MSLAIQGRLRRLERKSPSRPMIYRFSPFPPRPDGTEASQEEIEHALRNPTTVEQWEARLNALNASRQQAK
jgi:hypothetical protein